MIKTLKNRGGTDPMQSEKQISVYSSNVASLCRWRKTRERWSVWKALMGLKLKRESPPGGLQGGGGVNVVPNKQWELYLFWTLLDSHFLDSSICSTSLDSSTTFPLIMVWVTTLTIFLVRTSGSSAKTNSKSSVTKMTVIWKAFCFNTCMWKVCVAKDVLLCFATLLCLWHLICHLSTATASVSCLAAMRRVCVGGQPFFYQINKWDNIVL